MDDSIDFMTINFDFRPKDESIYCAAASTDKSDIPDSSSTWPFGYQIPLRCKSNHFILRRQSAKELAASMIRLNMTGFVDPFLFSTAIARTTTNLKIDQTPPKAENNEKVAIERTNVLLSTLQGTDISDLLNLFKELGYEYRMIKFFLRFSTLS